MTDQTHRASREQIDAALDRALASALVPPALSRDFRARLVARAQAEAERDLAPRRRALEIEYANQARRLRSARVRRLLETLPAIASACLAAGAAVVALAPSLLAVTGISSIALLYAITICAGTAIGWAELEQPVRAVGVRRSN